MRHRCCHALLCLLSVTAFGPSRTEAQRQMENLGRGLIAMRDGNDVYLGWRLLGTDPADVGFDVYRSDGRGSTIRLNTEPIFSSTNFVDTTVNLNQPNSYYIAPSIGSTPLKNSDAVTLPSNPPLPNEQAHFRIPLQPLEDHTVTSAWVGDLTGDGAYDYVISRHPNSANVTQKLEAYASNGDFLWRADMGPGSLNRNNIEPGPSAIVVGHHDGVTVFDMDGDGRAEVLFKSADGVTFGDGQTLQTRAPQNTQFVSVLDGMTGAERGRADVPPDFITDGPLAGHFGIGYLDGQRPSLVFSAQNRVGSGPFNRMAIAYDYRDDEMSQRWKWKPGPGDNINKFHQIRVGDVNGDGKDELLDGGFVINHVGSLLYTIPGIVHGDRFHVGDLDPDRPGLEGYGIQQDHPNGLVEYYYDAATGEVLREHFVNGIVDNGRGIVADIDPDHRGYEYWSFHGRYNAQTGESVDAGFIWPNLRVWWDADVGSEVINEWKIENWDHENDQVTRLASLWRDGATPEARDVPLFYGDILGDWREEIIYETADGSELLIFTTTDVTDTRLYTLAHNPLYRNDMTTRGYYQSNMVDYFLGFGMESPPMPDIFVLPLLVGDADGDGLVSELDLVAVTDHLNNTGPTGGSLLGDADGNGVVDAMDFYIVSSILEPQIAAGDFDQDGDVDGRDFLFWQRSPAVGDLADWQANYGSAALSATGVAVPELSTIWLFSLFPFLVSWR